MNHYDELNTKENIDRYNNHIKLLKGSEPETYEDEYNPHKIFYLGITGLLGLSMWLILLGLCILFSGCVYV